MQTEPDSRMQDTTPRRLSPGRRGGFTLMEVALSIAVVAVGIMALFALMTSGLESSAEALADTQAAVFADNVFSGLRGISSDLARSSEGSWELFFDDFRTGDTNLTVAVPDAWQGVTVRRGRASYNYPMSVWGNGNAYTNIYKIAPMHGAAYTNLVNHVLRYQLNIEPRFGAQFMNPGHLWTNVAEVTLKVWKDEFGSWANEDALVFYAEIDNPGDL